jgi:hypothetical protein
MLQHEMLIPQEEVEEDFAVKRAVLLRKSERSAFARGGKTISGKRSN